MQELFAQEVKRVAEQVGRFVARTHARNATDPAPDFDWVPLALEILSPAFGFSTSLVGDLEVDQLGADLGGGVEGVAGVGVGVAWAAGAGGGDGVRAGRRRAPPVRRGRRLTGVACPSTRNARNASSPGSTRAISPERPPRPCRATARRCSGTSPRSSGTPTPSRPAWASFFCSSLTARAAGSAHRGHRHHHARLAAGVVDGHERRSARLRRHGVAAGRHAGKRELAVRARPFALSSAGLPDEGPVLVTIEYEVDAARTDAFLETMQAVRGMRRRRGA